MKGTEDPKRRRYALAGVDRTVSVLKALAGQHDGLSLADVARRTELDEATALRYVSSLAAHDLVTRDERTGRYSLGLGLFLLGQQAGGVRDVRKIALPYMERLLEEYQETVNVAHAQQDRLVVIEVLESTRSIRRGATVGDVDVWHASALGKAILASLPEGRAVHILEAQNRERFTEHTKVEIGDLLDDLRITRERGYAIDDEEFEVGLRCVAAPIIGYRGVANHALSISGVAPRMSSSETVERMGSAVAQAAAEISQSLGFVPKARRGS